MTKYRAKQYVECHSMYSPEVPYCDACGYQFPPSAAALPKARRGTGSTGLRSC